MLTTAEKEKQRRVTLKHGQVVELADILRAHAKVENGYVVFDEGWSAEKVIGEAARRGFVCTMSIIESVCKQVLRAPLPLERETVSSAMKRIRELEFELVKTRSDLTAVMDFLTRRHGAGWKLKDGEVAALGVEAARAVKGLKV